MIEGLTLIGSVDVEVMGFSGTSDAAGPIEICALAFASIVLHGTRPVLRPVLRALSALLVSVARQARARLWASDQLSLVGPGEDRCRLVPG